MAGHSKYKNIMHRKGAQDKKRAKLFNKLAREITVAAKSGGGDPDSNAALRNAMVTARSNNMPNDRIKRAIEVATSAGGDANNYEYIRYEGYGSGGVAVIVEALTDNRNRTAGEVRTAFSKNGGSLGETNSVSFMFSKIGLIVYPATIGAEDKVFEIAVEAGAENIELVDDKYEISTDPTDFMAVREAVAEKFGEPESAEIIWRPGNSIAVNQDQAGKIFNMIEALEDSDDVQNVFANFDISDDIMNQLMAS